MGEARIDNRTLVNEAIGILPTASGWDTPPSDLANATDGSDSTKTGAGSKQTSGAGTIGYIILDRGANQTHAALVSINALVSSNTGGVRCYVSTAADGNNFFPLQSQPIIPITIRTTPIQALCNPVMVYQRYIQFEFYATAAQTSNSVEINEIAVRRV